MSSLPSDSEKQAGPDPHTVPTTRADGALADANCMRRKTSSAVPCLPSTAWMKASLGPIALAC